MGNQAQIASRFANNHQWLSIAKTSFKELIQNKLTRQVVEKHRWQQAEVDLLRHDHLVYQWRKESQTAVHVVEILEISYTASEQDKSFIRVCENGNRQTDLLVYTQNLLKLYEMNSRIQLTEVDQVAILRDIIDGIDLLSQKFGQFIPSKDSIGYNSRKRGKAWINDNFCCNVPQQKRLVQSIEERFDWQHQIIQTIVQTCKLCTTQNNYRNNKFYFLLEVINSNKLDNFTKVRDFQRSEQKIASEQSKGFFKGSAMIQQNTSKRVELSDSLNIASSNEFVTTQDPRQRKTAREQYGMLNKTFDIPFVAVRQPNTISYIPSSRTTYNYQHPQKIKFTHKEAKIAPREIPRQGQQQLPYFKQNRIEVRKHKFNGNAGEGYLAEKVFYPKKLHFNQLREPKETPEHYALLEQLYDSRSSRSESRMIKKQTIPLIDSMQVVQNRHDYDNQNAFHKLRNAVLEESVIFKAPRK